ncbi:Cytochrome c oxidase subunit 6A1, mitochondrial, partial [Lemmus lemmus]
EERFSTKIGEICIKLSNVLNYKKKFGEFQVGVIGVQLSGVGPAGRTLPRVGRPILSGIHGEECSAHMWKALTYFVALPVVGVSMLNIFLKSQHGEHERPRFVAYPHLCISTKPFPW